MINTKFEAYKIRRELKKVGTQYEFERPELNEFKEPTDKRLFAGKITGLYHEQNGYIRVTTGEAAQFRSKKIPTILCLYEDAKSLKINDETKINSKTYRVTGVLNIQEWNLIADVSLEVIDDGV